MKIIFFTLLIMVASTGMAQEVEHVEVGNINLDYVKLSPVKTLADAKATCANFANKDMALPTVEQYLGLQMAQRTPFLAVATGIKVDTGTKYTHVGWIQSDDIKLQGKDTFFTMNDGEGMRSESASFQGTMDLIQYALNGSSLNAYDRKALEIMASQLSPGIPVVCVKENK